MGVFIVLLGVLFAWLGYTFIKDHKKLAEKNRYSSGTYKTCGLVILVCGILIISVGVFSFSLGGTSNYHSVSTHKDDVKTCPICGREFNKGTDDSWSITTKNMCRRCYNNYKTANDMKEQLGR